MATATTAANIAAIIAQIEARLQTAVTTTDGVAIVADLAPLFAELGREFAADFHTATLNAFTSLENGVLSFEQQSVLTAKAVQVKLFADLANAFHPAPATTVPPPAA